VPSWTIAYDLVVFDIEKGQYLVMRMKDNSALVEKLDIHLQPQEFSLSLLGTVPLLELSRIVLLR